MKINLDGRDVEIDNKSILANDVTFQHEYNPHNVRLWVIGHEFGAVCAVWAACEQDAFDEMVDSDLGDAFLISDEDIENDEEYAYLGNAGEAASLDNAWIEAVDLQKQEIELLLAFAEARGGCYGTLDN